jgi:hypothetical protein
VSEVVPEPEVKTLSYLHSWRVQPNELECMLVCNSRASIIQIKLGGIFTTIFFIGVDLTFDGSMANDLVDLLFNVLRLEGFYFGSLIII